jgi:hypothetical protein
MMGVLAEANSRLWPEANIWFGAALALISAFSAAGMLRARGSAAKSGSPWIFPMLSASRV